MKMLHPFSFRASRFLGALCVAIAVHVSAATQEQPTFHFTVTSDIHQRLAIYGCVLDAIQANSGGQGSFQVSIGDLCDQAGQTLQTNRDLIDSHFGAKAVWYPAMARRAASGS